MIEQFADLVPDHLLDVSGEVFAAGRIAFSRRSPIYVLALYPGGGTANDTLRGNIAETVDGPDGYWCSALDDQWGPEAPGKAPAQKNILMGFADTRFELREIPSSTLIFPRLSGDVEADPDFNAYADACWPFHQAVIESLGVRLVLCLGKTVGGAVRRRLNAHELVSQYTETIPIRGWTSTIHSNPQGVMVASLSSPWRTDWSNPALNPLPMCERALNGEFNRPNR